MHRVLWFRPLSRDSRAVGDTNTIEVGSVAVWSQTSEKCLQCEGLNRLTKEVKPSGLTGHVRWVLEERVAETIPSDGAVDKAGRLVHVLTRHQQGEPIDQLGSDQFSSKCSTITYNPDAIKLHGVIVEILDLLNPPFSRAIPEEVWEGRVGSVELQRPCRFSNDTPDRPKKHFIKS